MKLRIIPTKTHAAVDLATGPALVAAPTLLRMDGNTGATVPPRVVGSLATAYALLTDYELGLKRVVPMRAHLALVSEPALRLPQRDRHARAQQRVNAVARVTDEIIAGRQEHGDRRCHAGLRGDGF